jgi:hypothetical protein
MIPGITSRHTRKFLKRLAWGKNYGNTRFVGGVSANNYGAVAFRMKYEDTQAQKG